MSNEPQSIPPDDRARDERLESLIVEYIRDSEAGRPPHRQELLKQYPEFASELKQFLRNAIA